MKLCMLEQLLVKAMHINGAIYASPDICYFTSNYAIPVISIKGDAIISGTGTSNNPFKVE